LEPASFRSQVHRAFPCLQRSTLSAMSLPVIALLYGPFPISSWQSQPRCATVVHNSATASGVISQDAGAVTFAGQSAGQSAPVLATTGSVPALVQLSSATHAAAGAGP
jgi:hypothetical protein